MAVRAVSLPGPVAIVPAAKLVARLAQARGQGLDDLDPERLVDQLRRMSDSGVPARLDVGSDRTTLRLYTDTHVAVLGPTNRHDGYFLNFVSRWGFQDHANVARGFLRIRFSGLHVVPQVRFVPPGHSTHLDVLRTAWAEFEAAGKPPSRLPASHTEYLDTVSRIVDQSRTLERERLAATPVLYSGLRAVREQRYSERGVYAFRLVDVYQVPEGSRVQVGDDRSFRGMVLRSENLRVVVRFDGVPDFSRLPAQGTLTVLPSDVVYRAQLAAVAAFRSGNAVNQDLLGTLADRRAAAYRPDRSATPSRPLDDGQLDAYQRALGDPDLLLVLGPPGTGKTWTITEIATAEAARTGTGVRGRHRTLVTSHSNQAVDNVLKGLASHLRCVRVGNHEALTGAARERTVEAQVEQLKSDIVRHTEPVVSLLTAFAGADDSAGARLALLRSHLASARRADDLVRDRDAALDEFTRRLRAPLEPELSAAQRRVDRLRSAAHDRHQSHDRARRRYQATTDSRLPGWFVSLRRRASQAAETRLADARQALISADADLAALQRQVQSLVAADPGAAPMLAARENAWGARQRALTRAARDSESLRTDLELAGCLVGEPEPEPYPYPQPQPQAQAQAQAAKTDGAEVAGWETRERTLVDAVGLARARATLLDEWRSRVPAADEELKHELVSYADVVAATCIGVATKKLLSGLDFDLAIVDEAGQISAPNLLVPLARARRAVLVGDHHQLPPYVDDDLAKWADGLATSASAASSTSSMASELPDMVRRSEFERLFGPLGPEHRVTLTVQRRMPVTVAAFVSRAFYRGALTTDHPGTGTDPLFTSPLAFVDTSDQPAARRAETASNGRGGSGRGGAGGGAGGGGGAGAGGGAGGGGVRNDLEANLIAMLLAGYAGHHGDWAVIVPYREQLRHLRPLLIDRLGGPGAVDDNIGTVDSFQGNERDLIVYGFTRSNRSGAVGFLAELRRLNVAMTRTRRQLVLVGDLSTLTRARDPQFASLMAELTATLSAAGDLRGSLEITERLRRLSGGPW